MDDDSRADLDERVDAYLDGGMSPDEAARFERELLREEAAAALVEGLALREMLRSMPPDAAPEGLAERIASSLPPGEPSRDDGVADRRALPNARAALSGFGWVFRGASFALAGTGSTEPALSGLGSVRYALGPLAPAPRSVPPPAPARSRRPLWKRALGLGR